MARVRVADGWCERAKSQGVQLSDECPETDKRVFASLRIATLRVRKERCRWEEFSCGRFSNWPLIHYFGMLLGKTSKNPLKYARFLKVRILLQNAFKAEFFTSKFSLSSSPAKQTTGRRLIARLPNVSHDCSSHFCSKLITKVNLGERETGVG